MNTAYSHSNMNFAKICTILMVFPVYADFIAPSLDELNKFLGYEIEFKTVRDLAERQSADVFWAKPKTVEQIKQLVKAANEFGLNVRPVGHKHSWSSLYADSGDIGLDLTLLEGNTFTLDKERMLASSLGSASLGEFIEFTRENGVTIPSGPSVSDATLQGVTATSAQGGVTKNGSTATYVYAIDLVDGQGRERHFNEDDDRDVITACKVHLGMCGIIYNTTVKVVPDMTVKYTKFHVKLPDLILNKNNMKDLVMNNYGLYILWTPLTGATKEEISARDADEFLRPPDSWTPLNDLLEVWVFNPADGPPTQDSRDFADTWTLKDSTVLEATSDYRRLSETIIFPDTLMDALHLRWVSGWLGAETEDFSAGKNILKNYFKVIEKTLKKHGMMYEIELGLIKWISHNDDSCTLCSSKIAGDFKMVIDFEWVASCKNCRFTEKEEQFRDKLLCSEVTTGVMSTNVLPQWAKMYEYVPEMYDRVRNFYRSSFEEFINIRNKNSLDPNNVFMNSMLKTLLHDVIHDNTASKWEL